MSCDVSDGFVTMIMGWQLVVMTLSGFGKDEMVKMPLVLSLSLSMLCDVRDGCVTMLIGRQLCIFVVAIYSTVHAYVPKSCDDSSWVNEARDPVMSSSSTVTYTSVYTDSEPGRVFWGADEELSDGGPEHLPSPDYVPGPEHPPSPIEVPYVHEPEYPEYLVSSDAKAPLED
ncbi:hypothetical protein Tco_1058558 [Tanacetum coccineum]|uniref:Transmembrane protein n=1 Tax=Tanacetum coccineum TaxID=301880 RepID=A0ABQ5H8K4_9ASTR